MVRSPVVGQTDAVGLEVARRTRCEPPPLVEPVAVQETVATGCEVFDDGVLAWLTFYAERRTPNGGRERVVTSRVTVPSAQYAALLRMMAQGGCPDDGDGEGFGLQ